MPELTFALRWPDGRVEECYSPSLVVHDFLSAGTSYTVTDLTARATTALGIASDRVKEKFGFACTSAAATTEQVRRSAAAYAPDDLVTVLSLHPPLPQGSR
jgi:uncharacterized repeat protein (TIGR04042 family)